MAKSNSKRKTRSDKFPVTLHKTGQYCKKIKGRLYYFGSEKKTALERYLEQAAYLHSGKLPGSKRTDAELSIKTLCNCYLDHQESRAEIEEIKLRYLHDQISLLRHSSEVAAMDRKEACTKEGPNGKDGEQQIEEQGRHDEEAHEPEYNQGKEDCSKRESE